MYKYEIKLLSGNLRIIDRKKDLVKLQLGEYVSLGKVIYTIDPILVKGVKFIVNLKMLITKNHTTLFRLKL